MSGISNRLGLFVWKSSFSLVCSFCLALGNKEICLSPVQDEACLDPNQLLPDGLSAYFEQPNGLELMKDTWREASHRQHF